MDAATNTPSFAQRHKTPLLLLTLLPVLANAIALSGLFNNDPTLQFIGLGQHMRPGLISGPMSWVDPSVAFITQPVGHLAASDWLHGIIPWWNPYAGVGMPMAAETQTSAFFLPFILLLHFNTGWLLLRILLQIGSGVFSYILFAELGLTRTAAFLGGALFALSPEFFLCPSAPIAPLPFLPLLLLGIEYSARAANQSKPMGWSLIPIACAYSFYAGNPEVAYFDGLLAGFWSLWRFFVLPPNARLPFAGKLSLGIGISLGLCAPLLLPSIGYLAIAYIGPHTGYFQKIWLEPTGVPLQIFPYLYGKLGNPPPAALFTAYDRGFIRVPGWAGPAILVLIFAALLRPRVQLKSLRLVLLFWIVLWEARYLGVAPVMWLMNHIPGIATTDSTRYSGPAVNFAIFVLSAFAFSDYQRLPALSRTRLSAILLTLGAIILAAVLPVTGFILTWYRLRPHDLLAASVMGAFGSVALIIVYLELSQPKHRNLLLTALLAGPLVTFILPQFAGFRSEKIDMSPIQYLQSHAGASRMVSLGPLDFNFPARYNIASINYSALPAPLLWTDHLANHLFPQTDLSTYSGSQPGQRDALRERLPAYEAIGVRYVVTTPGDNFFWANQFQPVYTAPRNSTQNLFPGGPSLAGLVTTTFPFSAIGAMSVVAGTYFGTARGPVVATLCAAGNCVTATADAGTAADNAPLIFTFPTPLNIPPRAKITYRFSHPSGTPLAIWYAPAPIHRVKPVISLIEASNGPAPVLVFRDATAAIFELPQAAPYAQTADANCAVTIISRQNIQTSCPTASVLTRRELFYPGWTATANNTPIALSQAGLFQSVAVPAGNASIKFSYAPPHIRLACALALLAGFLWAVCGYAGLRRKAA
ncbi:hypothetical protein GCM10010909_10310 [Acidocella aquatica]|uniref:Membrane protein YfhO n=1 Tax=Acidocella aquatica TaxID=1922313 RepID=A0ABQ6A1P3_9PROT|nr:hypothetical protein [Acidocella aquatica]GLR66351.1 hypothetical protein GCM10010909_10310 [Acidocella aquatica]